MRRLGGRADRLGCWLSPGSPPPARNPAHPFRETLNKGDKTPVKRKAAQVIDFP